MNKFHRYISFFLCLALIIFCLSPIRARAYVVDPYSSAYALVGGAAVEGFKEGAKLIASVLAAVLDKVVTKDFLEDCIDVLASDRLGGTNSFSTVFSYFSDISTSTDGSQRLTIDKDIVSLFVSVYSSMYDETVSETYADTQIYVPPDSVWTQAEIVTSDRLVAVGFHDLSELNENVLAGNKISWQIYKELMSLEAYFRTTFVETLGSEFDSLSSSLRSTIGSMNSNLASKLSTLDTSLGSIETSIDVMEDSLSGDLVDLKTLYSSFGQSTLDKLDTLNTSIQNLDSLDLSTDFSDLKTLYSDFGNANLDRLDSLISSSDSWFGVLNESFTNELQGLSGQLTDVNSSISTLDTNIGLSLGEVQGAIQALEGTMSDFSGVSLGESFDGLYNFVTGELYSGIIETNLQLTDVVDSLSTWLPQLSSLSDAINEVWGSVNILDNNLTDHFDTLNTNLTDHFTYISDLYLDEFTAAVASGVSDIVGQFDSLLSDTSHLVEVEVKLEELVDSDLLTTGSFNDVIAGNIGELSSTVEHWGNEIVTGLSSEIAAFNTDVTGVLDQIKDSLTTAFTPDTSAMDEADDLKISLFPHINNGFGIGGEYFGSVQTFLGDDLNGFLVAGMIFEEFAGIPFFYKLIITSCSVGLIGTLLGMALNAATYSVAQRRREEAAQSRAHSRIERSTAVYVFYH